MTHPGSRCGECPLRERLPYYVPPKVVESSKLAIVGEAPGAHEVALPREKRQPFVGPAGQLLDKMLARAGIDRSKTTVTNVLKCQPKNNKLPEDPAELRLAIDCCSELVNNDIVYADVVIGLGNVPLLAFTDQWYITRRRGSVYSIWGEKYFVGTIHPSALLRAQFVKGGKDGSKTLLPPRAIVEADLKRAKKISIEGVKLPNPTYLLYPTQADFDTMLHRLDNEYELVGIDIETSKEKKADDCVPSIISFALEDFVVTASFEEDVEFIYLALKSKAMKSLQNGAIFDVYVLEGIGFEFTNYYFDNMYGHHLLYAELLHRLEFIQSLYTYLPFHKDMKDDFEDEWNK